MKRSHNHDYSTDPALDYIEQILTIFVTSKWSKQLKSYALEIMDHSLTNYCWWLSMCLTFLGYGSHSSKALLYTALVSEEKKASIKD